MREDAETYFQNIDFMKGVAATKPKAIALLTCSAGDYAVNQGRKLELYEFIELEAERSTFSSSKNSLRTHAGYEKCEVVVDVRCSTAKDYYILMGIGLRLRKNEP